jgi:UDP-3-O-[3-hydroxymyristoyl] N-acetylglucosamine deacetylase
VNNLFRNTINNIVSFEGIGVHSGENTTVILHPYNNGIVFIVDKKEIPLDISYIHKTPLCTSIVLENIKINTIEHLLSAINALNITDIKIELIGNEIPILDGNSEKFFYTLKSNIKKLEKKSIFINLTEPVYYRSNDKFIIANPFTHLKIEYIIDYQNNFPNFMFESFDSLKDDYGEKISKARTFGFIKDYDYLKSKNLALGSSYQNTLVIDDNGSLNGLNYYNEPVRHKILDLIGDLTILGKKINAHIIAYKTGHEEHLKLIEKILMSC